MTLVLAGPSAEYHNQMTSRFQRPISSAGKDRSDSIKTNIINGSDQTKIMLALPGYNKEQVKVNVQDGRLVVEGKVNQGTNDPDSRYSLREFAVKDFRKSFELNDEINEAMIVANYTDGVLTLVLPKKENLQRVISVS